jgi:beta-lactamase class C
VGDCYAYQNITYALFSDITYAATGDFYEHEVARHLFGPLGMFDASIGRESLESTPEHALPHDRIGRGWRPFHPNDNYYRIPAAAGVNASGTDMAQWLLAQLGHRPEVLSPELLATLHTPLVSTPQEATSAPWRRERIRHASYALGWRIFDYDGHTLVFHGGAVRGYRSLVALLPDRDLGVAMMWNCESVTPSGLLPTLLDAELGLPRVDWVGVSPYRPIAKPTPTATQRKKKRP